MPKPRSFARNAVLLMGSTVLGQGITVAALPLLARLYTPAEFGVLAAYGSLVLVLVSVASLRYEMAIPIASKDADAVNLLSLCLLLLLATVAITGIAALLLPTSVYERLGEARLQHFGWMLPVGVGVVGLYQIFASWALREKDYTTIARTKVVQGVAMVMAQVGLGLLHSGVIGLLIGDALGRSSGTTSIARPLFKRRRTMQLLSRARMKAMAARYVRFPLYSSPASLLNSLGLQLPNLLLATLYGPVEAGLFMLATRISTLPADVIGQSVSQVYTGQASEAVRSMRGAEVYPLTQKVIRQMGLLSLGFVGVSLLAPWVFGPLFGASWQQAGKYAFVLSLSLFGRLVVNPISQITSVAEKQHWQIIGDAVRAVAVFASLYIPFRLGFSALSAIASYSLVMLLTYIMFLYVYVSIAKQMGQTSPSSAAL